MNLKFKSIGFAAILLLSAVFTVAAKAEKEYFGQFDPALIANVEDFEKVIFKYVTADQIKGVKFSETAHITATRIYDPQTEVFTLSAILVEEDDKSPVIFLDLNEDTSFAADEKFVLEQEEKDNPFLWKTMVKVPVKNNFFTSCAIFLRYFKTVKIEKMSARDRLITQSTEVFARGKVDVGGKKILAQYAYNFTDKKANPKIGWQGVDANEDGEIDMDNLSPEAANSDNETIVFRVGQMYLSTKSVDLKKNQIVMREHEAKEYKRFELAIGKELLDFTFVDLAGKKRKFSEFRGKYILLDVWGMWCPPCLREMPFLREAALRFQSRNFEIVALNTDPEPPDAIKKVLDQNGIKWTQARLESVFDLLNFQLRIESFPTTFLISPDGKILSMSRHERGEPNLRGDDLLETLDEVLPK